MKFLKSGITGMSEGVGAGLGKRANRPAAAYPLLTLTDFLACGLKMFVKR